MQFSVKANSKELYEAFMNECKKIGIEYNEDFTALETRADYHVLYFSNTWNGKITGPKMSFTNSSRPIDLEYKFIEAYEMAKTFYKKYEPIIVTPDELLQYYADNKGISIEILKLQIHE